MPSSLQPRAPTRQPFASLQVGSGTLYVLSDQVLLVAPASPQGRAEVKAPAEVLLCWSTRGLHAALLPAATSHQARPRPVSGGGGGERIYERAAEEASAVPLVTEAFVLQQRPADADEAPSL